MPQTRNGSFDLAKLFAACGIVWFHAAAPGATYGYAGLAFFLILLVQFTLPAARVQSFATFRQTRARRLLLPWIACCLLYGALKLVDVWAKSSTLDTEFSLWMVLTGPALHLWFLLFAFVAGLVVYPAARLALALPLHLRLPLAVAASLLCLWTLALPLPTAIPLAQWVYALPPLCLGLALLFAGGSPLQHMGLIGMIALVGMGAGWPGALHLGLAGMLLVLCQALPRPATVLSDRMGRMALTVYLLHPAVAAILLRMGDFTENSVLFAGAIVAGSLVLAALIDLWLQPRETLSGHRTAQA